MATPPVVHNSLSMNLVYKYIDYKLEIHFKASGRATGTSFGNQLGSIQEAIALEFSIRL